MNARKEKRERKQRRKALVKKLIVNAFAVLLLGAVGTFFFCLVFGVFREGAILL